MKVDRIRALREKRGISQSRAAKDMKIVRTTYSNYEAGNREPDFDTIKKIAEYFEVSIDYLLGHEETKLTPDKTDAIIREIVKEYGLDLTIPGQREKLESIVKLVVDDYTRK